MQQSEQSAQLSGHVTEANFAVKQYQVHIDEFKEEVCASWDVLPPCLETSAAKKTGLQPLLQHISGVRAYFEKATQPGSSKKGGDARFMRMLGR